MDREEFTSRISESRSKLISIARAMLPERDCEDAVQSAILSAWEHLSELRDESAFDAWITQILKNRCRQMQRSYKKDKDTAAALAAQSARTPEDGALGEALEQMRGEEREVLLKHHEQGYSLSEMSKQTGQSEDVLKMRLYRARKRLRVILISLLLLILLAAAAVGTDLIDVSWFLLNRHVEPVSIDSPMPSDIQRISYDGELLAAEVSDVVWNLDALSVSFVYSLAGAQDGALTVHSGNIGVDGVRFDHIWTDREILPIADWANGQAVQTFTLDGWTLAGQHLNSSEDYLPDGKGETFFAEMRLDLFEPENCAALLNEDGLLTLTSCVFVEDYASGETLEEGTLTLSISAPTEDEWRDAYEAHYR